MFHDGDVVQTQVPYDDFPITVVREGGVWRPVLLPADLQAVPVETRTDAEVEEWIGEEQIALVKVRQEHVWEYAPSGQPGVLGEPIRCLLCGGKYEPEDEEHAA